MAAPAPRAISRRVPGSREGNVTLDAAAARTDDRRSASRHQLHVRQPVRQRAPQRFGADRVAVDDDREHPVGQMTRIAPAFQLQRFRRRRILALRRCRVRVAAVGAHESIDHQF